MLSHITKRTPMIYRASTRPAMANIPAPKAPRFFAAAPVYGEGVAEDPTGFVPDGRIGEPVAYDPGPEPKDSDGAAKPIELALPVALTNPLMPTTAVELTVDVFVQEHSLSK